MRRRWVRVILWTAVVVVPGGLLLLPFLIADAIKRRAALEEDTAAASVTPLQGRPRALESVPPPAG